MKCLTIVMISTLSLLLNVQLFAQADEQIAALQDSIKVKMGQYGEKSEEVVNAYFDLFSVLEKHAKYEVALKTAKKCTDICLEIFGEKHSSTGKSYNNLGRIYYVKGNYPSALKHYQNALTISLNAFGEMDSLSANYYKNIGIVYVRKGDYAKALEYQQKALKINLEIFGQKHSSTAGSFNNIGLVYHYTGDYNKAIENYIEALSIKIETLGERHPSTASSFDNLGSIYYETNDYAKALKYNQKALEIRLEVFGEKHPDAAKSFNNLGNIYNSTGDYAKALEYQQKALEIKLEKLGEKHPSTASSFNNMGWIYDKIGDYAKALEYHQKALTIQLEILGEKHPFAIKLFSNMGAAYNQKGDYVESMRYHQKALSIHLEILGERHPYTAPTYSDIGFLYKKTGEYSKSLEYFQKAVAIQLEMLGKKHPSFIKIQVSLAHLFEEMDYFIRADSLWNIIIPNIEDQLNKNYLFLGDTKKILFLKTIEDTFNSFYNFTIQNGSEKSKLMAANLLINTKSQILDYGISTRQLIETINDENLDSIATQLNTINKKVTKAELLSQEELAKKGWSLDTLRIQQDELASKILAHPELKAKLNPPKFSWQIMQEKLKDDEALIDYFSFYDKKDSTTVYQAMLIKKDEAQPLFIPLSTEKEVNDLLQIKDKLPLYVQYKEARQELYGYVWKALEPHLKDIKTIHLTPVASLNKVDFESLQNENGQYLAGLYNFHYYSSSKDFYKQKQDEPAYADATLYGHIAYYKDDSPQYEAAEDTFALRLQRDTLVPLPATLQEVKAIEQICTKSNINPTLLTVQAAKEDTIEHFSGDRAPGIMHFATHGAYLPPLNKDEDRTSLSGEDRFRRADNPLQRSMLMLSNAGDNWKNTGPNIIAENDGILTALEVTNLDLSNTELVVLSACNSGIGSQHSTEGVFGLPRAFKLAGVDKILVSLWPVEDETTKELMIQFYTNLLQNKQDAATALQNAKAEMRKRNDAPRKWAGFVLVE